MMTMKKEVELTMAGKIALIEARLHHIKVVNRIYDLRGKATGFYQDLPSIIHDIATQQEAKKQVSIFEQQLAHMKSAMTAPVGLSLEEDLLVNQTQLQLYSVALEAFKHEWEQSTGEYKELCYNQIEVINKRIQYLSEVESKLVDAILSMQDAFVSPENAPKHPYEDEIILVDRIVLEGTLRQLGLCDTHIQHAINLMTVKAVG